MRTGIYKWQLLCKILDSIYLSNKRISIVSIKCVSASGLEEVTPFTTGEERSVDWLPTRLHFWKTTADPSRLSRLTHSSAASFFLSFCLELSLILWNPSNYLRTWPAYFVTNFAKRSTKHKQNLDSSMPDLAITFVLKYVYTGFPVYVCACVCFLSIITDPEGYIYCVYIFVCI